MSGLIEILKNLCLSLPTRSEEVARSRLQGVPGRGGFVPKLAGWLEASRAAWPETVRIEATENINDRGVDVYIEGQLSQAGVGFQIKSDNDLDQDDFFPTLKRQITEARAYAHLKLYVIVLACSPDRYGRIQHALNEELNQWQAGVPKVLLLVPGKVASLDEQFDTPLTPDALQVLLRDRTWPRFFAEVGDDRDNEFLNHWSGLAPDERFAPPHNLERIEISLREHPLTVLAGPEYIGKTFTAVQLLFRHFQGGGGVQWIKPPGQNTSSFIVPSTETNNGFRMRVLSMARRLGAYPSALPRNRWEFIGERLQRDALVLIEDPFGSTDAEYKDSLHTYDFFDLEGCIEGILEEGAATGCRLLMTTRHGLLDRWLAQRGDGPGRGRGVPKGMNVIHLGPDNYALQTFHNQGPIFDLSTRLLLASGRLADSSAANVEEVASLLAEEIQIPREVELLIADLQPGADRGTVRKLLRATPRGARQLTAGLCRASSDAERLFLLLLALSGRGYEHNDFASAYARLHTALSLPGEAASYDAAARARYWMLYYPRDFNASNTLFTADGIALRWGTQLTPSHSAVTETALYEVTHRGQGFLNRLAASLGHLGDDATAHSYREMLVSLLVEESAALDDMGIEYLADALPSSLKPSLRMSFLFQKRDPVSRLLDHWAEVPPALREGLVRAAREGHPGLAAYVCECFDFDPLPCEDAWIFYRILSQRPDLGRSRRTQPWKYFVAHLEDASEDLRALFDRLAALEPSRFCHVLGDLAGEFWDQFPPSWKEAILSGHASDNPVHERADTQENIYSGLFRSAEAQSPPELLRLLKDHLSHNEVDFRIAAGLYVLIHWEKVPPHFHDALRERFVIEPEPRVLLKILHGAMSREHNAQDLTLAEIVLERSDEPIAAWLMEVVRDKSREDDQEAVRFVERCRARAGAYARAFDDLDLEPAAVASELPLVQVAWVWKMATTIKPYLSRLFTVTISDSREAPPPSVLHQMQKRRNPLREAAPFMRDIAHELRGPHAICAHYILAYKAQALPPSLLKYLSDVEDGQISFISSQGDNETDKVREAVVYGWREGEANQQEEHPSTPAFPMHIFAKQWP